MVSTAIKLPDMILVASLSTVWPVTVEHTSRIAVLYSGSV